jgi:hypothetical protein
VSSPIGSERQDPLRASQSANNAKACFCQHFAQTYPISLTAGPKNEILTKVNPHLNLQSKRIFENHQQPRKEGKMKKRVKKTIASLAIMSITLFISALAVFGQTGGSDEVENLIKDMSNESWQIRWDAAAALGETKDPRAIESLIKALKDENSYVRMTAARSLGMIDDPRVMDPLIEALKDESHGVKKNAALSLKMRTSQDFGKDPEAWQKWWEQNK